MIITRNDTRYTAAARYGSAIVQCTAASRTEAMVQLLRTLERLYARI